MTRQTAPKVLDRAIEWLKARAGDPDPFFLYLHFMDVHGPYDTPNEDVERFLESPSLGTSRIPDSEEVRRIPTFLRSGAIFEDGSTVDVRQWRAWYSGGVHYADRYLGQFVDYLRRQGMLDDVVLVVTSDHGEALGEHHQWNHGRTLYQEELSIPLLVRMPGGLAQPSRRKEVVGLVDIMPTLLDLAALSPPARLQGRSFARVLQGEEWREPRDVFVSTAAIFQWDLVAARNERFKLILDRKTGETELFDLRSDPKEQSDISRFKTTEVAALIEAVERHFEDTGTTPRWELSESQLAPEDIENLKALGYVN